MNVEEKLVYKNACIILSSVGELMQKSPELVSKGMVQWVSKGSMTQSQELNLDLKGT